MGSYSTLRIGKVEFSWKYYVPTFLAFLFRESDFFTEPDDPDEEEWFDEIGFRSTCGDVLTTMDQYGYTVEFFGDVYDVFYDRLTAGLESTLEEEFAREEGIPDIDIPAAIANHLSVTAGLSRSEELRAFIEFLQRAVETDFTGDDFAHEVMIGTGEQRRAVPGQQYIRSFRATGIAADFESLQMYFLDEARRFSPAVVRVAMLFDEDYVFEYPEVISLMYTRLLLEATPRDAPVVLDLRELSLAEGRATAQAVKDSHAALATILADKITLYNRVFKVLSTNERDIRETAARARGRSLQLDLRRAETTDEKGRLLEELIAVIFEGDPDLQVVERRFSTGDEEIDLVIKNNVARPFWGALNSPLILVECKNWSRAIGSSEARDFEIKLQNHRPLVKVGIFVAYGGVTREFMTELKRAGRSDYHLAVVTADHIARFLAGGTGVVEWLEAEISRPI